MSNEERIKDRLIKATDIAYRAFLECGFNFFSDINSNLSAFLGPIVVKVYEELKKLEEGEQ